MNINNDLSPSMEDYLESILKMETLYKNVRVKDIAEDLKVQMPSVTGALKTLRTKELINYEKNSHIKLTDKGMEAALSVQERHRSIARFLSGILVLQEDYAEAVACRIEHVIKPQTSVRFKKLTDYLQDHIIGKHISRDEWEKIIGSD